LTDRILHSHKLDLLCNVIILWLFVNKNAKNLKRDIGVNPGEHVIQNNTEPASDSFQWAARKWFDDIQKPK
jgi:hypothetical protein